MSRGYMVVMRLMGLSPPFFRIHPLVLRPSSNPRRGRAKGANGLGLANGKPSRPGCWRGCGSGLASGCPQTDKGRARPGQGPAHIRRCEGGTQSGTDTPERGPRSRPASLVVVPMPLDALCGKDLERRRIAPVMESPGAVRKLYQKERH